jgi:putative toxin-antitoxin system antitoxin component (TIGR02293 family)
LVGKPKQGVVMAIHIHTFVRMGISLRRLLRVARAFEFSAEEMAGRCSISRPTFYRLIKMSGSRMTAASSDLLLRHAALLDQATDALGDTDAAKQWLRLPQVGLGGIIPLEMVSTMHGFREVEKLITRINYGVYC